MSEKVYFLGTSTPKGFISTTADELTGSTENKVCILKGTAGCGKSTLMKKISEAFPDKPKEIFRCSADPYSYDAVYFSDIGYLIMDGTSPHCYDPKYPIAVQSIIDLGANLDASVIRSHKDEIISLTDDYSEHHKRCRLCLSAISSVAEDIISAAGEAIDKEKLAGFAQRTAARMLPKTGKRSRGKISYRQLSAVTMDGYKTYIPSDIKLCQVTDNSITAAAYFMHTLAETAVTKGFDVIISECMICSEPFCEHIIVPEAGIGFITSNCINNIDIAADVKNITLKRFYCSDILSQTSSIKHRIRFDRKAIAELSAEASSALSNAKSVHDRIESYYIAAADFDSLNRLAYKLISEIKSMPVRQ
ncbi:MAG: ATPase [Huintestinicola sp.]